MADAPDRIWAEEVGTATKGGQSFRIGRWITDETASHPHEYIRADVARADAELAVSEAFRRAADLIVSSAYTSNGDRRSLEPVAESLRGADQHHATIAAAIRALAPAGALAEVQRLREAVEALVVVLDRNDKKGPIPDVEMMFCWLAAQGVRAAFQKIAQKGEAT